jgi:hypothetical protein
MASEVVPTEQEDRVRKQVLRWVISKMNEVHLQYLSKKLVCSSGDLLRQAMMYAVDILSGEELLKWEEATDKAAAEEFPELRKNDLGPAVTGNLPLLSDVPVPEDVVGSELSDFTAPEAHSSDPDGALFTLRDCFPSQWVENQEYGFDNCWPTEVSRGRWLAEQQELRTKDFVMSQLERQLEFERGRGDWLTSELTWRELREGRVTVLAQKQTTGLEKDVESDMLEVGQFLDEDLRLQDAFTSETASFWSCEANSTKSLRCDLEQQVLKDRCVLDDTDRAEYDQHLITVFHGLRHSFESRRFEAREHQRIVSSALQMHHGQVRSRHLQAINSCHGEGDE